MKIKNFLILIFPILSIAQKPTLDLNSANNWTNVVGGKISDDGQYVCYSTYGGAKPKLTIQSTVTNWKSEFVDATNANFIDGGFVFQKSRDSLCILKFENNRLSFIPGVTEYKTEGDWLFYRSSFSPKKLLVKKMSTGAMLQLDSVISYSYHLSNNTLLVVTGDEKTNKIQLVQLHDGAAEAFWSSTTEKVTSLSVDNDGGGLAFLTQTQSESASAKLWYYKKGFSYPLLLAENGPGDLLISNGFLQFTKDGKRIFIQLHQAKTNTPNPKAVQVDVWSYNDNQLQSVQQYDLTRGFSGYTAVVNIEDRKLIQMQHQGEIIVGRNNDFALLIKQLGLRSVHEAHWNKEAQFTFYLVSLKNGSRKLFKSKISNQDASPLLFPECKWVIFYDPVKKNYFASDPVTGELNNVTGSANTSWIDKEFSDADWRLPFDNPVVWLKNDEALIISDGNDLWLADPSGSKISINLTRGYGKKHQIRFGLLNDVASMKTVAVTDPSTLWLTARNTETKEWGFFKTDLKGEKDPELCFMGPYIFGDWNGHDSPVNNLPQKAKNADVWLLTRNSATEAPNYFLTRDFKTYTQITNAQPQLKYNWYTTELHQWKSLDGKTSMQGILYKPENFDSNKRYPILFDYYQERSEELNMYILPIASEGRINIPMFVSNGYLVFVPDIRYKPQQLGEGIYNSIVSAARYLSKYKWVDAKNMGLQGHSFGGYETNYLVTQTGIFAAACSVNGTTNLISWYGSGARGGFPIWHSEKSQSRLVDMLWERPDLYLKYSPVLYGHRVTTPLLMINNKNDIIVPYSQGVEFLTSLRRLGKRAWMLQYDNGGHEMDRQEAEDFHTRMMQFFDHYLKDSACPKWMLYGIPAKNKGVDDGLELVKEKDKAGRWITPPVGGVLIPEEKKRVEALQKRKPLTITLK